MTGRLGLLATILAALVLAPASAALAQGEPVVMNPAPTARDWADLAQRPDISGLWVPDIRDQASQMASNPPPWNAAAAAKVARQVAAEHAGAPEGIFANCLPMAMPAQMLVTHTAIEIFMAPGRVLILGESDSGRLRRIYTDGRAHPADPDLTFHGHSTAHWEGSVLVVDTVGLYPQNLIALSEAIGIPNNGDMHIAERIYLADPNTLHDDLVITAPHVLTQPWKTTRVFTRERNRAYDIVEGVCHQGDFTPEVDKNGDAVWTPSPYDASGNPISK